MVILRAFLALAAGFATIALVVIALTALLGKLTPGWAGEQGSPRRGYVFVSLGYSFLAAAAGGYVTAWAAQANPLIHVLALAALSAMQAKGELPIWVALAMVAIMPLGVLAGGLVRLRVLGIL